MLTAFSCWFFLLLHPIHISVTEINHSTKDKALQMTSRIFIDDLELAIQGMLNDKALDLMNPKNGKTTNDMVKAYLEQHIQIKIDGKDKPIHYLGFEQEDLALICYIEIPGFKKAKTIEVKNSVIMETHEDQSNLVHITYNGPVKSARLVRDNPVGVFKF